MAKEDKVINIIKKQIDEAANGTLFFNNSFPGFDDEYVGQILSELAKQGSVGQELSYTLGTQYIDLWSSSSLQGIAQTSLDSAPASFVTSLKRIA